MRPVSKTRARTRARRGFSLVELLVAMVVLTLLTSAAAMGITQALRQRDASIKLADAQTLASTTAQIITDELRCGRIVQVDTDGAIVLSSGTYAMPIAMGRSAGGHLIIQGVTGGSGGTVQRDGREYELLGQQAYCGLHLSDLSFAVDRQGDTVRAVAVSLTVSGPAADDEELWQLNFSVSPMNGQVYTL